MAQVAVSLRDLEVVRSKHRVLGPVSVDVPAGRVTGLLGPSGSGKTTLIRSVVGVQRGVSGAVQVLGRPAGDAELRSTVAYMTQAPSVYNDLTVAQNLVFFSAVLGVAASRRDAVLEQTRMTRHRDRVVGTLSGGERARVSLAVALLGGADLLVLDEPTVGLDPLVRRDLWLLFHELADAGTTLLVSSHVMDEAGRCDHLLLLREGLLLAAAPPDEIRRTTGQSDLDAAFVHLVEQQS